MDKSWIQLHDRGSRAYLDGVENFITFAFKNKNTETSQIKCPCNKCVNQYYCNLRTVRGHIVMHGFYRNYKDRIFHGEIFRGLDRGSDKFRNDKTIEFNSCPRLIPKVQEAIGIQPLEDTMGKDEPRLEDFTDSTEDMPRYFKLLKEAENELYEGCPKGITELLLVAEFLHLKQLNGWTNSSFTMLELLKKVFPNAKIPKSFYQANKLLTDLRGRKLYAKLKEELKEQRLPVDKISLNRHAQKMDKDVSNTDGSALKKEMVEKRLNELLPKGRNNVELMDKTFKELIRQDGRDRAPKRSKTLSSSSQHYEVEIARLRQEAEEWGRRDQERDIHYQEELDKVRRR